LRGAQAERAEFGPLALREFVEVEKDSGGKSLTRKLGLWFVLLIAGFLTGLILQHARLRRVQQELSASTKIRILSVQRTMPQLRDTATVMYLEAMQKNYGA
jgi:hypothetical protein